MTLFSVVDIAIHEIHIIVNATHSDRKCRIQALQFVKRITKQKLCNH